MCGVSYASFDIKWLFHNIEIGKIENEHDREGLLINAKKGIHAVEAFIVSRYHMYEQVYFHKTTRCFETITQKIFERVKHLMKNDRSSISCLNDNLFNFIEDNNNLQAYLTLDDFNLYTHFNHWIDNCKDDILKSLCESIIYRKPFKMVRDIENDSLFSRDEYKKIEKIFSGDESQYYLLEDEYLNVPYKDTYLLGKNSAERAEHIWLKFQNGKLKEFSEVSPIINHLKNNELRKKRAYIHRNYEDKFKKLKLQ